MITELELSNFKNFSDFKLSPMRRITLLGGKNNAGKTSILESIFLFYDRFNPAMFMHLAGLRGMEKIYLNPQMVWEPMFYNFDISSEMKISLLRDKKKDTLKFSPSFLNTKSVMLEKNRIKMNSKNDTRVNNAYALNVNYYAHHKLQYEYILSIEEAEIKLRDKNNSRTFSKYDKHNEENAIFLTNHILNNSGEEVSRFGKVDIKPGQLNEIIECIRLIEPRIKSLSTIVAGETFYIYAEIEGLDRKIPIKMAGDGTARLLSMILSIADAENGVVLIDEIENGLHYSVMEKVWTTIALAAKQHNCQLFVTTHSYECLKSALLGIAQADMEDDFMYARLDYSQKTKKIVPKIFDHELLKYALNNNMEVR